MENQNNKLKKQRGRDPVYDAAFKIAVATEYLTGSLGYLKLARKHNLPSAATVRFFVKWYKTNYSTTARDNETDTADNQDAASPDQSMVEELKAARLKIAALETMISIASKELGIDITKKAGAKQSKP